jgi:hypothetical protein
VVSSPPSIDENAIAIVPNFELSIMEDKSQDLPYVLQMYRGFIGFGEPHNPSVQLLFQAAESADWRSISPATAKLALNAYFALQFTDDRSTLVQKLRADNRIPAGLVAYALFPDSFQEKMRQQIRHAAAQQGRTLPITGATIQFSVVESSGIDIKSVK